MRKIFGAYFALICLFLAGCNAFVASNPVNNSNYVGFARGSSIKRPAIATNVGLMDCPTCNFANSLAAYNVETVSFNNALLIVLPTAEFFYLNSPKIKTSASPALNEIAQALQQYPCSHIQIQAFTDNVATDSWNYRLSTAQAQEVAMALWSRGVQCEAIRRLTYQGKATRSPIASNLTLRGMSLNRRIEIWVSPVYFPEAANS